MQGGTGGGSELGLVMNVENPRYVCVCVYISLYIYIKARHYIVILRVTISFLVDLPTNPPLNGKHKRQKMGLGWGIGRGGGTSVSPYREIGLARNVEVKISKMFQKGLKLTFSKGHFKIFHNNIFIF